MKELIGIAVLVASLFGGTLAAERIYQEVRRAALTKAATGLPALSPLARALTTSRAGVAGTVTNRARQKPKEVGK